MPPTSLQDVPVEVLAITMQKMNACDLSAFISADPRALQIFVDPDKPGRKAKILKFSLSLSLNDFGMQTARQVRRLSRAPFLSQAGLRALNALAPEDIFAMSLQELEHLYKLCCRFNGLIRHGIAEINNNQVGPPDWRFPFGVFNFYYHPATTEVRYASDQLYSAMLSGCLAFDLTTRLQGTATHDGPVGASLRALFGMPTTARIRLLHEQWQRNGDVDAERRYKKYVLQLTDLGLISWIFMEAHEAAIVNGRSLPANLSHFPGLVCGLIPGAISRYSRRNQDMILASIGPAHQENTSLWIGKN